MNITNQNIKRQQDTGITCLVTNSKGVTSIVVGTNHMIDAKTILNPCIQKILTCSEIFTERGTQIPFCTNDGCFPGVEKHDISYPHTMDGSLTIMAAFKKIPITSLDHQVPEMQNYITRRETQYAKMGAEAVGDLWAARLRQMQKKIIPRIRLTLVNKMFQLGALEGIHSLREKTQTPEDDARETKWSEILIPKLLEAEKPIGIAVGFLHVVGKNSLSERFAKAGLKVEVITRYKRSRL